MKKTLWLLLGATIVPAMLGVAGILTKDAQLIVAGFMIVLGCNVILWGEKDNDGKNRK